MSVTLKDIANELGISTNAVSRALRGMPDIGEKTKALVIETAKRMGYRKNLAASCLKTARSMTVGVVIPDICNPVFSYIYKGIEAYCAEKSYTLMLGNSNESSETEDTVLDNMIAHSVDGIVIVPCDKDKPYGEKLDAAGIPFVILQRKSEHKTSFVQTSDYEGGYLAAKHLAELGHRSFMLVFPSMSISSAGDRYNGFIAYLTENGISASTIHVLECDSTRGGAKEAMLEHLGKNGGRPAVDAIFCFSDYVASGVYSALAEFSVKIPEDISVIGYDNDEFCDILSPALTTVDIRPRKLGNRAAALLMKEIISGKSNSVTEEIISPKLIIRKSTR